MKKLFVAALVALSVGMTATASEAKSFSDVPTNHWAYDAVCYLVAEGVISGYGDNSYHGGRNVTRYEMAQMLARAIARNHGSDSAGVNPFSDVSRYHWAYDAVAELASEGVVSGYGDGNFRGDKNLTRYEMAQMLVRAVASKHGGYGSAGNAFSDVPNSHWARDAVAWLGSSGIVSGYGDGTFRGDKSITRYEMAQMIAKAIISNHR